MTTTNVKPNDNQPLCHSPFAMRSDLEQSQADLQTTVDYISQLEHQRDDLLAAAKNAAAKWERSMGNECAIAFADLKAAIARAEGSPQATREGRAE